MKHVVYRFRFEEDDAEYYGVTTSRRLAVRWYEHHRGLRPANEVLTYRLQKEAPYLFRVVSVHPSRKMAENEEAACIENARKVLNRNHAKSNSIYEREKTRWGISEEILRDSPEGPDATYVVYRYCFIKDGARYYGSTSELRAGRRCYEHRYTSISNEVLHYRLKEEWPHILHIISKHPDKKSARYAEKTCIKNEDAKVLNRSGAGDHSIYEHEIRKYKIPRKQKREKDPNGAVCNICEKHRPPERFAESVWNVNGMRAWCNDCADLKARLKEKTPALRQRMKDAKKEGRCIVCGQKTAKTNELSCCTSCHG